MLRHSDHDVIYNWNTNFVDGDTSNCVIQFISQKKKLNFILTNDHANSYLFESLNVQQRKAFDNIINHY